LAAWAWLAPSSPSRQATSDASSRPRRLLPLIGCSRPSDSTSGSAGSILNAASARTSDPTPQTRGASVADVGNATARLGVGDPLERVTGSCRGTARSRAPRVAVCPAACADFLGTTSEAASPCGPLGAIPTVASGRIKRVGRLIGIDPLAWRAASDSSRRGRREEAGVDAVHTAPRRAHGHGPRACGVRGVGPRAEDRGFAAEQGRLVSPPARLRRRLEPVEGCCGYSLIPGGSKGCWHDRCARGRATARQRQGLFGDTRK
jgi:hypothetical protein